MSREQKLSDTSTLFFGNNTRDEYFDSLKNRNNENQRESPFLKYINLCKNKGILPIPCGFAQKRESLSVISLDHSLIGDEYAEAFAETLKYKKSDYSLSLKNNRLSQSAANKIIQNLGKSIISLDLSYNPLVKDLNTDFLFSHHGIQLKELNLEGNNIGDLLTQKISEYDHKIEYFNLAKNLITNKGARFIAENLFSNRLLVCLNLSWNNIQTKGGIKI